MEDGGWPGTWMEEEHRQEEAGRAEVLTSCFQVVMLDEDCSFV